MLVEIIRDEELELDVVPLVAKISRICKAMNVAARNYLKGGDGDDKHCVEPILTRLANTKSLNDISAGLQNLEDVLKDKSVQGTLKSFIFNQEPQRTYLNREAPLCKTRSIEWIGIFNHAITIDPGRGNFHSLRSLLKYADQTDLLLKQLALHIRIYNKENKTVNRDSQ